MAFYSNLGLETAKGEVVTSLPETSSNSWTRIGWMMEAFLLNQTCNGWVELWSCFSFAITLTTRDAHSSDSFRIGAEGSKTGSVTKMDSKGVNSTWLEGKFVTILDSQIGKE